jgi:hypothetical protein
MLSCDHCQRTYQRKLYFDRHVIACQFLSQSKRERTLEREELADTPSVRELYSIILALAAKCEGLETKLTTIQKWAHITKQKLNITDWLKTTYPAVLPYADWFAALKVDAADLSLLFETDYVGGVLQVLKNQLALADARRPIRAFTTKENTFYIGTGVEGKWQLYDTALFTTLMHFLDKEFMREFIAWQNANKGRIRTDDSFADLYAKNMKKVMGGNFTREQLYARIKKELYAYMREDPPNIVEYETTFTTF